jgi:hypothetical protein
MKRSLQQHQQEVRAPLALLLMYRMVETQIIVKIIYGETFCITTHSLGSYSDFLLFQIL